MFRINMLSVYVAGTVGLMTAGTAAAGPVIGFDPTGSGTNFVYSDIWGDAPATGVSVSPRDNINEFVVGDVHEFSTQFIVSSFQLNGGINTPAGLNSDFELTKEINFLNEVTFFNPNDPLNPITSGGTVNFGHTAQTTSPNLTLYFDDITDGSQAISGSGPDTVDNFGSGTAADDGFAIMTANVIANSSSFNAFTPGVGTGSFDLTFEITSWNTDYLDLTNLPLNGGTGNPLFATRIIGNTSQPLQTLEPVEMWNGTSVAGNQAFSITASESFTPKEVPTPSSILLIGTGLLLLSGYAARRRSI